MDGAGADRPVRRTAKDAGGKWRSGAIETDCCLGHGPGMLAGQVCVGQGETHTPCLADFFVEIGKFRGFWSYRSTISRRLMYHGM